MVQFGAIDGASKSIILQKDAPLHESFVVSSESKEASPHQSRSPPFIVSFCASKLKQATQRLRGWSVDSVTV
jgi:hypothetical protein